MSNVRISSIQVSSLTLWDTFQNLRGCLKPHTVPQYQTLRILCYYLCLLLFSIGCDSLWPHGLQHARLPCPSLFPRVCSNSHVRWVSDAIQWSHPLLSLLLLPSVFPSIRVFSNESALCIRWPKYWSFSFVISPSNEYSGLISFRMDWLDLLAVQGTLKSLLQYCNSKAPIVWH